MSRGLPDAAPAIDVERLIARDKRSIGRAITLCEDARPQSAASAPAWWRPLPLTRVGGARASSA